MIPSELNISHLKLNLNICDKIAVFSYQNLKAGVIGQVIPCLVNYFLAPKYFHTIDVQSFNRFPCSDQNKSFSGSGI